MSRTEFRLSRELDESLRDLPKERRIAALRERMAVMGAAVGADMAAARLDRGAPERFFDVVQLPERLARCFPGGGLPRKAVSQVSDCATLAIEIISAVTEQGGYVAVVGWADLLFAGVVDSGGDVSKIVSVPDPGIDALPIAAVFAEGMDMVVCRSAAPRRLTPTNSRPFLAKVRQGSAAMLLAGISVPSPALTVSAQVTKIYGLDRGGGRIRGLDVEVEVASKSTDHQRIRTLLRCGEAAPMEPSPGPGLQAVS